MSKSPKAASVAVKSCRSAGHEDTSVLTKRARGDSADGVEYSSTRACASGRSERSAKTTLQLRERSRRAKARLMPRGMWLAADLTFFFFLLCHCATVGEAESGEMRGMIVLWLGTYQSQHRLRLRSCQRPRKAVGLMLGRLPSLLDCRETAGGGIGTRRKTDVEIGSGHYTASTGLLNPITEQFSHSGAGYGTLHGVADIATCSMWGVGCVRLAGKNSSSISANFPSN